MDKAHPDVTLLYFGPLSLVCVHSRIGMASEDIENEMNISCKYVKMEGEAINA